MLIVPELHAIFIMPPRTGSGTLTLELMRAHPSAFLLYRHAEATLVPAGYETWRKVGFVRHPLARLWSLYKFCAIIAEGEVVKVLEEEVRRVARSVEGRSFEEWVLKNEELFLPDNSGIPVLHQAMRTPETRKSQFDYLRPDLGTIVLKFQDLPTHLANWQLNPNTKAGATPRPECPPMTPKLKKHMMKYFKWDMEQNLEIV